MCWRDSYPKTSGTECGRRFSEQQFQFLRTLLKATAGWERGDFTRHLSTARGSLAELECLLDLATDVGYLDEEAIKQPMAIAAECNRMIWVLVKKLGSRQILPGV